MEIVMDISNFHHLEETIADSADCIGNYFKARRWVIRVEVNLRHGFNLANYQFSFGFFDVNRRIYDGNDLISVADKSNQTLTIKHFSYDKGAILRTSFTFIRRSSYMICHQNQSHQ